MTFGDFLGILFLGWPVMICAALFWPYVVNEFFLKRIL